MIEKRVYNGYAFSENEREKNKINWEIYNELKQKYKILQISDFPSEEELANNDIVYSRTAGYHHSKYNIHKSPDEITLNELCLICDNGNLCFGGTGNKKNIRINED